MGVYKNTYSRWERGEREPSASDLARLVLEGWNVNWLLTGRGSERLGAGSGVAPEAAHDLSWEHLSIALQLADKKIRTEGRDPSYDQYAKFVGLIYEGITKGLPEADHYAFDTGTRKPVIRVHDHDPGTAPES